MFVAVLSIIARNWKRGTFTQWYIIQPLKKRKEIMKFVDKWMELEKLILSSVAQTQKEKCGIDLLMY